MDISEWLKNEDIQRNFRKASGAVATAIYNEMYVYIWFICVYNIFLLIVVVINLYLLVKLWRGTCQLSGKLDVDGFSEAN